MIECIEPPSPRSASSSTRSIRRTPARLTRYCPSPPRWSLRVIASSEKSSGPVPSALSKTSSTSQESEPVRAPPPAKSTSSGFSARSSLGESEPAAQTIASAMFDLPEPFGPTTTATPGSRRTSTGSGNDLKPRRRIERRCTRPESDDRDGRDSVGQRRVRGRGQLHELLRGHELESLATVDPARLARHPREEDGDARRPERLEVLGHRPRTDPLRGCGGGLAGEVDRVSGEEDGHLVAFL